ncbi:hypothetical protein HPB50_013918 [Hyalomma asiaticum]|uniref:Uncharacterized protein n=1 Tax=Hyalomma asiaticum TaxID=266040 RepID=A0ACB7SKS9_HYAAI|nr:hypothetical protein HPB50_013918 [Hyalomma asiaticum]
MDELLESVGEPSPSYGSRMSDDATLHFLSLVEQFPALWDPSREEYANAILRSTLWQKIAEEMQQRHPGSGPYTPESLRTFFNNKRRTYRNERKKVGSTRSGQPAEDSYTGKWKFFSAMTFLEATQRLPVRRTVTEAFGDETDVDGDDAFACTLTTTREPSPAAIEAASSAAAINRPATRGTSRAERHTDLMSKRTVAIEKIANAMQDEDDASAHFCKATAAFMRMLSVQDQIRCQKDILDVIQTYLQA